MRTTMRWFTLGLLLTAVGQAGLSGTIIGKVGKTCFPTTYSPPGFNLEVYGDWIENVDRVAHPTGVSVSIVTKKNGAQNNTGPYAGRGLVVLRIGTNNAAPGEKTIRLIDDPILGVGGGEFSFTITVLASPTVTGVDVPPHAEPFNDITVMLRGTGLQGADDPATGAIVIDNLVPFITIGGDARVSSVRVLSSSSTSLQARIFFSAMVQDATVALTLRSDTRCTPLGSEISLGGFKTKVRVKSTNVKNYVKSITFPTGSTIDKNSTGTINVNLLFRESSTRTIAPITMDRRGSPAAIPNVTVFFKFSAPQAIVRGDGTEFPKDGEGFIVATARSGDDVVPITFKVKDCLGGTPGATNAVQIQTWMQNKHTNQPPEFVQQTFYVRCTQ